MEKKFKITIDIKWCKGCGLCVNYCPQKILYLADDFKVHVSDESECIGCHICEFRCPDFAIFVNEVKKKEEKIYN
ncbi:4Fe-4S binding protein [candidate division WOR-3 bacterium]|nr:4Fe-4S binding protein [candidate division WOR-3 bacterium]